MQDNLQVDFNLHPNVLNQGRKAERGVPAGGASEQVVILCDRRALTLQCLARGLAALWPDLRVCAATDARAVVEDHDGGAEFDLAVINAGPCVASEPWVGEQIGLFREHGDSPIVLIGDREDFAAVAEALRAGVRGYIPSSSELHLLIGILQLVRAGGTYMPAVTLEQLDDVAPTVTGRAVPLAGSIVDTFTPKETEILRRLKEGKPNKIIAYELDICESTVKVHMRQIMRKLSATNRTQAALIARQMFADAA